MDYVAETEPVEQHEHSVGCQPLAFLDTDVILGYLHGEPAAVQVFSAEANGRIRFAINAVVLQELLLAADAAGQPVFEQIRDHLRVLPVDFEKAETLLPNVRVLRNSSERSAQRQEEPMGSATGRTAGLIGRPAPISPPV